MTGGAHDDRPTNSSLPGFDFRYRRGGGHATVRTLLFRDTGRLTRGDMLRLDRDAAALAVTGDTALLGAALQTLDGEAGATPIQVIIDGDAIYGVDDPHARVAGDLLVLTGATGAQVVAGGAGALRVERDSRRDEETLVAIAEGSHYRGDEDPAARRPVGSELNAAIARAVTRAFRDATGRGPTKTRAFYRGDVLVVVMEGLMTTAERTLVTGGRAAAVLVWREAFQEAMRVSVVRSVEELTGVTVRAFMSTNDVGADIALEAFVLDRPIDVQPADPGS